MRSHWGLSLALVLLALAPTWAPLADRAGSNQASGQALEAAAEPAVTVGGSPTASPRLDVRLEAGGRSAQVHLWWVPGQAPTPAPVDDRIAEASPMGPVEARMQVQAGPVVLEGPGSLSPRFPVDVRVVTEDEDRVDRAWLRVDGDAVAELVDAGQRAGDGRVFLGGLPAGHLPAGEGARLAVVFERQPTPATRQVVEGPGWRVHVDETGPPPPDVQASDGSVHVDGPGEGYEAETRTGNGSWQPAGVKAGEIFIPEGDDAAWARARGVDGVGNPGPWSPPVKVRNATESRPTPEGPWRLVEPRDGATVRGLVNVDWRPANASTTVEVQARPATPGQEGTWRPVGEATSPPIEWRTGFVPDGDWQLRVRAHVDGSWISRLVDVTVDNLDEQQPPQQAAGSPQPTGSGPAGPATTSPLPTALLSVAALGILGGGWRAVRDRDE